MNEDSMYHAQEAIDLLEDARPQAALVHAILAMAMEQRSTNELLRLMAAKDTAVDLDEGADWSEYQEQQQEEYVHPPILCSACEHTEAEHANNGCVAIIDIDSGQRCGCPAFDDIPF